MVEVGDGIWKRVVCGRANFEVCTAQIGASEAAGDALVLNKWSNCSICQALRYLHFQLPVQSFMIFENVYTIV